MLHYNTDCHARKKNVTQVTSVENESAFCPFN